MQEKARVSPNNAPANTTCNEVTYTVVPHQHNVRCGGSWRLVKSGKNQTDLCVHVLNHGLVSVSGTLVLKPRCRPTSQVGHGSNNWAGSILGYFKTS